MADDPNDWRVMPAFTQTDYVLRRRWSYLFSLGIVETSGLGAAFLAFFGFTWVLEHPLRLGCAMAACTLALHASAYAVRIELELPTLSPRGVIRFLPTLALTFIAWACVAQAPGLANRFAQSEVSRWVPRVFARTTGFALFLLVPRLVAAVEAARRVSWAVTWRALARTARGAIGEWLVGSVFVLYVPLLMLGLAIGFAAFTIFCVGSRDPDNVYYDAFLRTSLLLGIFAVSPVTRAFAIRPTLEFSEPCTEHARSPTP